MERDGILANGDYLTVSGNTVTGNGGDGISITGTSPTVSGNTATGNGVDGILVQCADTIVSGGIISGNTAIGNSGNGITVSGDGTITSNNIINENGGEGLTVNGDFSYILDNTVYQNEGNGIIVSGSGVDVSDNTAYQNGGDGIDISGDGAEVTSNSCHNNFGTGIDASGAGITVTGNTATSNGGPGILVNGVDILGEDTSNNLNLNGDPNALEYIKKLVFGIILGSAEELTYDGILSTVEAAVEDLILGITTGTVVTVSAPVIVFCAIFFGGNYLCDKYGWLPPEQCRQILESAIPLNYGLIQLFLPDSVETTFNDLNYAYGEAAYLLAQINPENDTELYNDLITLGTKNSGPDYNIQLLEESIENQETFKRFVAQDPDPKDWDQILAMFTQKIQSVITKINSGDILGGSMDLSQGIAGISLVAGHAIYESWPDGVPPK